MYKFLVSLVAVLWFSQSVAEDIDLQALVRETQINKQSSNKLVMVWWIPTEFWAESFRRGGTVSAKQSAEMLASIDDYVVVAAIDGTIGTLGVLASTPKDELEKKTLLIVGDTKSSPIPEGDLSPSARNFVQLMKPVIANMLGQVGQGMHFMAFKGTKESNANDKSLHSDDVAASKQRLIDPKLPGRVTVRIGEQNFEYRLPLGSLLSPKFDPDTGERYPGNYEYSPYSGKKLDPKKP
jgi:hypothetical protein